LRQCTRCGSNLNIEKHHIKPRSKGGKSNKKNLRDLCRQCHDFIHAEMEVTNKIKYYRKRIRLLRHRLEVLRKYNEPEIIKENGYQSYWKDPTTHEMVQR
jgi:5-methylcytosine-specific restriction endonuclease McrA